MCCAGATFQVAGKVAPPLLRTFFAILAFWLMGAGAAAASPCGGLTGFYAGHARIVQDTELEVSLNLLCDGGRYRAQFFTSDGDYEGDAVATGPTRVTAKFDTGVALGTIDLVQKNNVLAGAFDLGDDKGVLQVTRTGEAKTADAMRPRLDLTPAQWRQDVRTLAERLPKMHANAFFSLKKSEFDAEIAALEGLAETANADEMFIGLKQITKSIGDGHTGMGDPPDRRVMPIAIARFGDDFRVTEGGPGLGRALGARVVKIGGMPIAQVWDRVLTLTARAESQGFRDADAPVFLSRGYALHGLDVIPDRDHAVYALEDNAGRVFDLDVRGLAPGQAVKMKSIYRADALRYQRPDEGFWCKTVPAAQAVYCNWRSYEDLKTKAAAMFALIGQSNPKKLIIDMRDNGGGDNTVGFREIVKPVEARADLNAPGHLYVLIGPLTFSAAMNNAAQFQDQTNAILTGQAIGERPNSYQEPRQFHLPNSHLVVRVSTRWYAFRKKGPNQVSPDKEIIPTWSDVTGGRDPVLDWVLRQPVH
jgi:hypothetical protein